MPNRPTLVVRLRVDPSLEEEFTRWYHHEYLDKLLPIAPLFVSCRRYVSGEGKDKVFLTIYEIKDEASIDAALAVFDRPDRQDMRRQWQAWEQRALTEVDARVFTHIYPE